MLLPGSNYVESGAGHRAHPLTSERSETKNWGGMLKSGARKKPTVGGLFFRGGLQQEGPLFFVSGVSERSEAKEFLTSRAR